MIEAWKNPSDYKERRHWIVFENVDNLRVEGGGRIDGNGHIWWPNSCKINPQLVSSSLHRSVSLKNLKVNKLTS